MNSGHFQKGRPKTGGRVKGTPNRATARKTAEIAASGLTPIDYMLGVMRDENAAPDRRDRMAAAVAPFVHPRLAVIDARVREETPTAQLDDEERRQRAKQMILEAFKERPEPPVVIAGKPTLRVIEHEPASDEAKSEQSSDRSG